MRRRGTSRRRTGRIGRNSLMVQDLWPRKKEHTSGAHCGTPGVADDAALARWGQARVVWLKCAGGQGAALGALAGGNFRTARRSCCSAPWPSNGQPGHRVWVVRPPPWRLHQQNAIWAGHHLQSVSSGRWLLDPAPAWLRTTAQPEPIRLARCWRSNLQRREVLKTSAFGRSV